LLEKLLTKKYLVQRKVLRHSSEDKRTTVHAQCLPDMSGYWIFNSWSISDKFFEYPYPILIRKFL